nr:FIST C-terminal domain-containing protein [Euzebyales bacterium]
RAGLGGAPATLATVFVGGEYADRAEQLRSAVADCLHPEVLVGVTAQGVIAETAEIETPASLSVWAAALPGVVCTPLRYPPPASGAESTASWPAVPEDAHGLVVLADPFTFPVDGFLAWLDQARPGLPVTGGLASGSPRAGGNRLLLDDQVHTDGAVGVALGGGVRLTTLVSQGCRPVGRSYVVTGSERNIIVELGGQPAVERIQQAYAEVGEADRQRMRAGLHIGLVIDEYAEQHGTGDFLVRSVLGADPERGAVAVGDLVRLGQTVRFHVRDADSADEDLRRLLGRLPSQRAPDAALLFTCNGRGSRLFGRPDHDAALVHEALGGAPLAGFFAAGELGPVGGRGHLHGFTASLLTVSAEDEPD